MKYIIWITALLPVLLLTCLTLGCNQAKITSLEKDKTTLQENLLRVTAEKVVLENNYKTIQDKIASEQIGIINQRLSLILLTNTQLTIENAQLLQNKASKQKESKVLIKKIISRLDKVEEEKITVYTMMVMSDIKDYEKAKIEKARLYTFANKENGDINDLLADLEGTGYDAADLKIKITSFFKYYNILIDDGVWRAMNIESYKRAEEAKESMDKILKDIKELSK